MDCRTHERGVGMLNTPYVKKDTIKNFFPVPNAVFDLGLHHMEISIYAYLLRIEDRRTYQCIVSYPDGVSPKKKQLAEYLRQHPGVSNKSYIARETGMDRTTVQKYYDEVRAELAAPANT